MFLDSEVSRGCGAWHWNVVDVLMSMLQGGQPLDTNIDGEGTPIQVPDVPVDTINLSFTVAISTRTAGVHPRSTPLGDGHDAYPGLASIGSSTRLSVGQTPIYQLSRIGTV